MSWKRKSQNGEIRIGIKGVKGGGGQLKYVIGTENETKEKAITLKIFTK